MVDRYAIYQFDQFKSYKQENGNLSPRYNACPTQEMPITKQGSPFTEHNFNCCFQLLTFHCIMHVHLSIYRNVYLTVFDRK